MKRSGSMNTKDDDRDELMVYQTRAMPGEVTWQSLRVRRTMTREHEVNGMRTAASCCTDGPCESAGGRHVRDGYRGWQRHGMRIIWK